MAMQNFSPFYNTGKNFVMMSGDDVNGASVLLQIIGENRSKCENILSYYYQYAIDDLKFLSIFQAHPSPYLPPPPPKPGH